MTDLEAILARLGELETVSKACSDDLTLRLVAALREAVTLIDGECGCGFYQDVVPEGELGTCEFCNVIAKVRTQLCREGE